jgi:hypothetical protein
MVIGSALAVIALWILIGALIRGGTFGIVIGVIFLGPAGTLLATGLRAFIKPRQPAWPAEPLLEPLRIPVPTNPPGPVSIASTSGRGIYKTDLSKQTCTCGRFVDLQRTRYQIGDIRRLCGHLCKQYCQTPEFQQLDELKLAMVSNGYGIRTSISLLEISKDGQPFAQAAFLWEKGDPWVDVFAPGRTGRIERFGFSYTEKRWSYGDPPPDVGRQLKAEILKTIRES